jgi:Salmonella virulence plasmid 65kDa B protein
MLQDKKPAENRESQELLAAPSISPPQGGGAIRGIGEKFAANPVTSTGSVSVPIATSPGRAGFGAQLFLSFDSGAGNGRSAWTAFALPLHHRENRQRTPELSGYRGIGLGRIHPFPEPRTSCRCCLRWATSSRARNGCASRLTLAP